MHVFILTRMPYGIDPPLTYTSLKYPYWLRDSAGFVLWHDATGQERSQLWFCTSIFPLPRAKPLSSHHCWHGLSKIQALLQNGDPDLEFPELQDGAVWNSITGSSLEATIWLCLWVPPTSTVVSPVSWPQTCSLQPEEFYEPWHISTAELHSFETLLGRKRRHCGEEGARNKNSPKMLPYIRWHFQKLATDPTAWRSSTVPMQHGRSTGRKAAGIYWNTDFSVSARGCACPARSGLQGQRAGAVLQPPRKTRGEVGAACGTAGSQLRIWGSRLLARSICPSACGAPALTAGSSITCRDVAEASTAQQRRADGAGGCRSCLPPAAFPGGHPEGSGQPRAGEKPNQQQLLLLHFSSFTESPPSLWGLFCPPNMTSLDSIPPEQCISDLAIKTSLRLVPF